MLSCFDGITGLAHACASEYAVSPAVPLESFGVDETMIAQFTGAEDTVASIIYDAEQLARITLQTDVLSRYASRIIPRTFLHAQRIGEPDEHQTLVTGATGRHGVVVEVHQPRSNTRLTLGGLRFYGAVTEVVTITIYDLSDGSVVDTVELNAEADQIVTAADQITIELPRRSGAFFIAHDLPSWRVQRIGSGCSSCVGGRFIYGGVIIGGASLPNSAQMVSSNLRRSSFTGGLSLVADVACDHGQYLCEHRSFMQYSYAMKVAENILRRGIYAVDRINTQRINLDLLKERADRLAEQYAAAMSNLLQGMTLPGDDICFSCARYSRVVTSAP
jgi:hypothetical protein